MQQEAHSDRAFHQDTNDARENPEEKEYYPSGSRLAFVLIALALSIFFMSLDLTIVAIAIPKITDEFHGLADVSWYSSAFFVTIGGFQSAWGNAYKYFPLKSTFLVSICVFELGSLICGVASNSTTLIVRRAIAGLGAAGLGSGVYTIIAFSARPTARPMFTGIIWASYGIAAVVGPLIGGAQVDVETPSPARLVGKPVEAVSVLIIVLFFKTPSAAAPKDTDLAEKLRQMDLIGVTLVMGAVISYILALHYGGQKYAWSSSPVVGLLVGFVVLLAGVYLVEAVFTFFFTGAYFLVIYYLPIYSQSIDNVSAAMSGSAITMISSGLLYTLDMDTTNGMWIGYQIVGRVGWGLAMQVPIITGQATAPPADLAEATAILLFFQTVGGAFLVSAAQDAFVNVLVKVLPESAPDIDPVVVVNTGATNIQSVFPADQVPGVLAAYMRGLKIAFTIGLASTGVAFTIVTIFQRGNKLNRSSIANPPHETNNMKPSRAILPLAVGSATALPILNLLQYRDLVTDLPQMVHIVGLSDKLANLMDHGRIGPPLPSDT
ncbi:major facilitator superfamily domain-containing protein [Aspergillus ambiguus]|uniref:major facilitator superfamily domain-containing protein n=1 Tax=Aspergillus ambiguus TaxID=176160 RepID=UPI003CCCD3D7